MPIFALKTKRKSNQQQANQTANKPTAEKQKAIMQTLRKQQYTAFFVVEFRQPAEGQTKKQTNQTNNNINFRIVKTKGKRKPTANKPTPNKPAVDKQKTIMQTANDNSKQTRQTNKGNCQLL